MVEGPPKQAHSVKWSRPSRWTSSLATLYVAYGLYVAATTGAWAPMLALDPLGALPSVTSMPLFVPHTLFAFVFGYMFSGYHYKQLGVWLPRSELVDGPCEPCADDGEKPQPGRTEGTLPEVPLTPKGRIGKAD